VNAFPKNVGDRKLNSSNIIAFLQARYHFTGEEKYKKEAYKLINRYSYWRTYSKILLVVSPCKLFLRIT
tara:strand:+ start:4298 stop:4504 length:207 start_codon:yes stop_codon:yes gene_type:complete